MFNTILHYIFAPFITAIIITPAVIFYAKKTSMVAEPKEDRWHSTTTPLLGGVSIFIGIIVGIFYANLVDSLGLPIISATLLIFISGLYDDIKGMPPYVKLLFQIVASTLVMSSGILVGKVMGNGKIKLIENT